jgi:hypothetical protein
VPVLTVLNQGTDNNSSNKGLVVTNLQKWMGGAEDQDWMITQGVGSKLNNTEIAHNWFTDIVDYGAGVGAGYGITANVNAAIAFIQRCVLRGNAPSTITVNMAGHSRGSVTCFKQATAIRKRISEQIKINIFAIDPVPGNLGVINSAVYKGIKHTDSIKHCTMFLAEHERRDAFRPVVDSKFLVPNSPSHTWDTMPGNHAGIVNMHGPNNGSARLLFELACQFLHIHGTVFNNPNNEDRVTSNRDKCEVYSHTMLNLAAYKRQGEDDYGSEEEHVPNYRGVAQGFGMANNSIVFAGGTSGKHRQFQTREGSTSQKAYKHVSSVPFTEKKKYFGHSLTKKFVHLTCGRRFFANNHHRELFQIAYPITASYVVQLEISANPQNHPRAVALTVQGNMNQVQGELAGSPNVLRHFRRWHKHL